MAQNDKNKPTIFQKFDKFGDWVLLNILFAVSCIPIITIGAAVTALYSFMIKQVKDEETTLWRGYWKAFRDNFKQATQAWLVVLVLLGVLYVEFCLSYSLTGMGLAVVMGLMAIEAVYLSFTLPLLFPLIARYENTTANMFKNAFLIAISNLGSWFYLFFIWVLPIALYASSKKVLYYSWYLWVFLLVSLLAYASSMVLIKLFDKLEAPKEEVAEADAEAEEDEAESGENDEPDDGDKPNEAAWDEKTEQD